MSKFQRKSSRLKVWDYSNPWWYFVTICTQNHIEYFGSVKNGKMILSEIGKIAEALLQEIPMHYIFTEIDENIVMPNHIHVIIIKNEQLTVETGHAPSLQLKRINSLGNIVGSYKSAVTKKIHESGNETFKWQPRFYDRIIRNETELYKIRKYIQQNPLKWELEKTIAENIEL